jgi:protoporphyrinogen oxidase
MNQASKKVAIIIGAGPAGLTAAYELIKKTDIQPVIFEASNDLGGLAKTAKYKGNRIDIGGHRFFSKSDRVMQWWQEILPLQAMGQEKFDITYHNKTRSVSAPQEGLNPETSDKVMLVRHRLSRIFFLRKFFNYPIALNAQTISNLGFTRMIKIGFSYIYARIFPIKVERSLEDFFINRFGRQLYRTFFKDYTEKVWGLPCNQISPEWGAQRIKGLSMSKAIFHMIKNWFKRSETIEQKNTETSLIERFLYPKFGPGQMWEEVARIIQEKGGKIVMNCTAIGMRTENGRVVSVTMKDNKTGQTYEQVGDYFFSTMPVRDLVTHMSPRAPENVFAVANGLKYRDFITVGLLLSELKIKNADKKISQSELIPDNWIYIQERDVKVGRLQIFNNWSPYMLNDKKNIWLGMEYFCNEGDELWQMRDQQFIDFAAAELEKIGIIDRKNVLDGTILRVQKAYPAYFGTYAEFDTVRKYLDTFSNLYLIGRNGMHRYNNQDHSMLTAMIAVENIINNVSTKDNLWAVNTEEDYHEAKSK